MELERVCGRVEMGVRVSWDVPNIFEFFVNTHLELKNVRDRIFGTKREPNQEDMIEVGRTFDRDFERGPTRAYGSHLGDAGAILP